MPRNPPGGLSPSEETIWLDGYDTGYPDGESTGDTAGREHAYDKAIEKCEKLVHELANLDLPGPARRADRLLKKLIQAKADLE